MESTLKHRLRVGGVGLAGLAAGVVLAGTISASAVNDDNGTGSGATDGPGNSQMFRGQRPAEKELTGSTAEKVKAAALAKYPGATVLRVEADSDGAYEAHLIKADGTPVTVKVDKSFKVTGEETGFGRGFRGPGGPGGLCGPGGPGGPGRGETPLTGTTADKVKAAALAKYPGATVLRVETDSDGAYEAHLVKADGTPVTVQVDKSFKITGERTGRPDGFRGPGGFGQDGGEGTPGTTPEASPGVDS